MKNKHRYYVKYSLRIKVLPSIIIFKISFSERALVCPHLSQFRKFFFNALTDPKRIEILNH